MQGHGKYTLGNRIGGSTHRTTFVATDNEGNRVAVRVFTGSLGSSDDKWRRLLVSIMALHHPNILRLIDFRVQPDGVPYEVMELADPTRTLAGKRRLTVPECQRVAVGVCDALQHAHSRELVHRNLKPSNVFFDQDTVKVSDFWYGANHIVDLTHCQQLFAVPTYFSPEQCMGKPLTPATDVYSLACVLYEALTGDPPFYSKDPIETASMHLKREPNSVGNKDLDAFFAVALAKEPRDRFSTQQFKAALSAI